MPNYDFVCPQCGATKTLLVSYSELEKLKPIMCCDSETERVYGGHSPRYAQLKGHYNSSYEGQKETKDQQKGSS